MVLQNEMVKKTNQPTSCDEKHSNKNDNDDDDDDDDDDKDWDEMKEHERKTIMKKKNNGMQVQKRLIESIVDDETDEEERNEKFQQLVQFLLVSSTRHHLSDDDDEDDDIQTALKTTTRKRVTKPMIRCQQQWNEPFIFGHFHKMAQSMGADRYSHFFMSILQSSEGAFNNLYGEKGTMTTMTACLISACCQFN